MPLVFLHGGPGGGVRCRTIAATSIRRSGASCSSTSAAPDARRRSADLTDNTTRHLVADIERLREHLGIDKWLLFGGSWGSTLALAYAEAHPERCLGLVLRGIFLARPSELDWFMHGMRTVFPEAWRAFAEFLPPAERGDLLGNYYRRLTHPDPAVHLPAAQAWDRYEGACSKLLPPPDPLPSFDSDASALAIARIEAHYFVHRAFLGRRRAARATSAGSATCRASIVQGRYDIICPPVTADALARAWPECRVHRRSRRRPFGARARHRARAGRCGRAHAGPDRGLNVRPATAFSAIAFRRGRDSR